MEFVTSGSGFYTLNTYLLYLVKTKVPKWT